jgi:putative ABC transport system substrate-binding protein
MGEPEVTMRHPIFAFVAVLAFSVTVGAQPGGRVFRVGYLSPDPGPSLYSEAFRQGLRDLGWIEGENLAIDYRWADQKLGRLSDLATELVRYPVDLIFCLEYAGSACRCWFRKF